MLIDKFYGSPLAKGIVRLAAVITKGCPVVSSPSMADLQVGSAYRREIKRRGKVRRIVCHKDNRICFLITKDKTIVRYNVQTFLLEPIEVPGNLWARRLNKIQGDILKRKITCMNDLVGECHGAVNIIPVKIDWFV